MYVVQNMRLQGFKNLSKAEKVKVITILIFNYGVLAGYVVGVAFVLLRAKRTNVP